MARETKVQRELREAVDAALRAEQFLDNYPDALLDLVYDYSNLNWNIFSVERNENIFIFRTEYRDYVLPRKLNEYSATIENALDSAQYEVRAYLAQRKEEMRLKQVKDEAKRKVAEFLTDEEQRLLNLK